MSEIGIKSLSSVNYSDKKNVSVKTEVLENTTVPIYSKDTFLNKENVANDQPFGKSNSNKLKSVNPLEKALVQARANNDSKALFDIFKAQSQTKEMSNTGLSNLLREAYNTALSEMDSDTLYEIANLDASKDLLPEISSEFIFRMADMTRKIY